VHRGRDREAQPTKSSGVSQLDPLAARSSRACGCSRQAVSQLLDTLVARGYLQRAMDPADRRRLSVSLTERGRSADRTATAAVAAIDQELADAVGADAVEVTRDVLLALLALSPARHHDDLPSAQPA